MVRNITFERSNPPSNVVVGEGRVLFQVEPPRACGRRRVAPGSPVPSCRSRRAGSAGSSSWPCFIRLDDLAGIDPNVGPPVDLRISLVSRTPTRARSG